MTTFVRFLQSFISLNPASPDCKFAFVFRYNGTSIQQPMNTIKSPSYTFLLLMMIRYTQIRCMSLKENICSFLCIIVTLKCSKIAQLLFPVKCATSDIHIHKGFPCFFPFGHRSKLSYALLIECSAQLN